MSMILKIDLLIEKLIFNKNPESTVTFSITGEEVRCTNHEGIELYENVITEGVINEVIE